MSLFVAALALYGAVWLVANVWQVLAVIVLVLVIIAGLVIWWQRRRSPW